MYCLSLDNFINSPSKNPIFVFQARVSKRGRKLIDYDNAKHSLDVLNSAKKKDDAKINKVNTRTSAVSPVRYCYQPCEIVDIFVDKITQKLIYRIVCHRVCMSHA